jgi:hypothetical protein
VADYYGLSPGDLIGPGRTRQLTPPWHLAVFLVSHFATLCGENAPDALPQKTARLGRQPKLTHL